MPAKLEHQRDLKDFKVLVFDVFGTLIDWEGGLYKALLPLLSSVPQSATWSRQEALHEFSLVEAELQVQHPDMIYSQLLDAAYHALEAKLKGQPGPVDTQFSQSIKDWLVFPDTVDALRILAQHYKLVILSNVDRLSMAFPHARLSGADLNGLDVDLYTPPETLTRHWFPQQHPGSKSPFSIILTAQDTQAYKPSLKGFQIALDLIQAELGIARDQVLIVAQSLFHDHVPANTLGLSSVFIDRQEAYIGGVKNGKQPTWTWKFDTIGAMAQALDG